MNGDHPFISYMKSKDELSHGLFKCSVIPLPFRQKSLKCLMLLRQNKNDIPYHLSINNHFAFTDKNANYTFECIKKFPMQVGKCNRF